MEEFHRIKRLPPYVFSIIDEMKLKARRKGEDIIDLGMGNPDLETPKPIVDKLIEAAKNPKNHRYSVSRGIYKLRVAITKWYKDRYDVDLDPDTEAIVTIGVKEGLSHLALAIIEPGDVALVPSPTYPIHSFCVVISGGNLKSVRLSKDSDFFENLLKAYEESWPRPKLLFLSFPHNPTTEAVDINFFHKVVSFAREHGMLIIHDFAYADITFGDYKAPSLMQIKGAKEVGVEFYTLSKSYNMPGWRVGFCVGNKKAIHALGRLKSYFDYGIFQPIQIASIVALNEHRSCIKDIVAVYESRCDMLISGLSRIGWNIEKPKGTMFVWAEIPEGFKEMGSLEYCKLLLSEGKVAVSPGIGFGPYGDGHVRFALVENEQRIKQAVKGIKKVLQ
ncbi:MAG: alanine transaminase [Candidatus Schekmanbacteria bacterium GWA2_38_11]|uniref:Alanine transaminase n=1 Tax=Candidatus Schekmanbacteria bacterium GWA2_38_11 TaxID=1817876 RepID=A0A1F7RMK3_9BACT|nr:MAG: alanine transaminase [Candidatus Schekmanbacteria bacterium GWA2_38_11]